VVGRLVDDDAHGALLGMFAQADHAALEAGIAHVGHGEQQLAPEVIRFAQTAGGKGILRHGL
jgi:hypothetical protein